MKTPTTKKAELSPPPVFPKTLHRLRPKADAAIPKPKSARRDNVFSKSRDVREDRGSRQMKTSHNAQSFSRGR